MKIETSNLKQYLKIPIGVSNKGNRIFESVLLNPKEGYIYTFGEIVTRIKLIYTGEPEDSFFVPLDKFSLLINSYDSLDLNNKVFSSGKDIFELAYFVEDDLEIPKFNDIFENENSIEITSSLTNNIKDALYFIEPGLYPELDGIFVRNEHLIATNKVGLYNKLIPGLNDITLPLKVIKILIILKDNHNVKMHTKNGKILMSIDDGEVEIKIPAFLNLNIPDTQSAKFISSYNHDTFIIMNRLELVDIFKFIFPFSKEQPSERVLISIIDSNTIQIKIIDSNKITKEATILECSEELIGSDFWISAGMVRETLNDINTENIKIQLSSKSPATNFTGIDDDKLNIVISQIKAPEDE